jgi:hypothetical protein
MKIETNVESNPCDAPRAFWFLDGETSLKAFRASSSQTLLLAGLILVM